MWILTLKISKLIQWNISKIVFFIEVTPSNTSRLRDSDVIQYFLKVHNTNYMTQTQTKKVVRKNANNANEPGK